MWNAWSHYVGAEELADDGEAFADKMARLTAQLAEQFAESISQRQFYLRCNTDRILPEFTTYYFKTPEGQHRLLANANQVGVPSHDRPPTSRQLRSPRPPSRNKVAARHAVSPAGQAHAQGTSGAGLHPQPAPLAGARHRV